MGYTTEFDGEFSISPQLEDHHREYLIKFAEIRHMKRDVKKLADVPDPLREAVGLPVGQEGMYFVNTQGYAGQKQDSSVIDYNREPEGIPGLWLQWIPNETGEFLEWDLGEKFYEYVPWLEFMITHFFKPWGYTLNGEVEYQGEDPSDFGKIIVTDNIVTVKKGKRVYE